MTRPASPRLAPPPPFPHLVAATEAGAEDGPEPGPVVSGPVPSPKPAFRGLRPTPSPSRTERLMTAATWITMIAIMAFVWGGLAVALLTAIRKESAKRAE